MPTVDEMMLGDLEARYAKAHVVPAVARLYPEAGALNRMCGDFHQRLNGHFEFMNRKAAGDRHFNAEDSRQLISLIDEIDDAREVLKHVGIGFDVHEYYEQTIEACRQFLVEAYGSTIPDEFERIRLIKYEPVFRLPDTHIRMTEREQNYELKMIAEGAFAFVYRYDDPVYGIPFALKRAKKELDAKELIRFRQEFDLLRELHFPYVLEVYRYSEERNEYTMEFCDATLSDYIARNNASLGFGTRKRVALQFLYGLNYLHSKGHLHRDISLNNVLIKQYDGAAVMVKLSDFGLSKAQDSELTQTESELRGTILDPTIRSFKEYNILNEVYSIGFVLSFIFSGRKDIAACSGAVRSIIDRCVSYDLGDRYVDVLSIIRDVDSLESDTKPTL